MTEALYILAALSGAAVYFATGVEHGIIYHHHIYRVTFVPKALKWWDDNVHRSGNIIHYGLSAGLVCALLIGQGVDWWSLAAAALLAGIPYLLADPIRQYYINIGADNYDDPPKWWTIPIGAVCTGVGAAIL